VLVLLEFFSAFGAEGGVGWAFFSAAFAGDWLFASGLFEVFLYGFEGFLYFFSGCLERLFHFDPHFRKGFSPVLCGSGNACFYASFGPEATLGAEICVVGKFFSTMDAESHEHRLRQNVEKNDLSIAMAGSVKSSFGLGFM
jgi:hypothetical protein